MKHPKKVLRKYEVSKSMVKVSLDNPCSKKPFKFGTIKGIRKDHFLLNTHSSTTFIPTGKISAINLKRISSIKKFHCPVGCPSDSRGHFSLALIAGPGPVDITFLGLKMEVDLPQIKVQSKQGLDSNRVAEIMARFSGLLAGCGISHTFVYV